MVNMLGVHETENLCYKFVTIKLYWCAAKK